MGKRIDDVARAAGVSTATVSRVINNDGHPVSAGTRRKVEQAIKKLGYKPNVFARGLMKATTDSVGIIVPFLSNPYHTEVVDAIIGALARHGVFVHLSCSYDTPELEREAVRGLIQWRVDAIIVVEGPSVNTRHNHYLDEQLSLHVPIILVNEHLAQDSPYHVVRCAQEPGLREALERFVETDKRRIALFRGGANYSFELKERLFRQFARAHSLPDSDQMVARVKRPNSPGAVHDSAALITDLLRGRKAPQAVLAGNDLIALGVVQGALAFGARVPEDIAVISVDNTFVSELSRPRLTAVDLRMKTVGHLAAKAFLDLRRDGFRSSEPIRRSIDARLVMRETS